MKIQLFIALAAITLLTYSCKKDASLTPAIVNQAVIGKWTYTLDTAKLKIGSGPFQITNISTFIARTQYIQFNADGTGVNYQLQAENFTYTADATSITFHYPDITDHVTGAVIPAFTSKATIRIVTANQLSIFFDTVTGTGNNASEEYEAQYFSK